MEYEQISVSALIEGRHSRGVAEGLGVIWVGVICLSINRREEQFGVWQKV